MAASQTLDSINHNPAFLQQIESFIAELSDVLMAYFAKPNLQVEQKSDQSPVSEADFHSQQLIMPVLQRWLPGVPVISEESALPPLEERQHWPLCWLVDPLDGTREFVAKRPEFSVNIALIEQGRPVWGLLLMPAKQQCYWGGPGVGVMTGQVGETWRRYTQLPMQSQVQSEPSVIRLAASRHYGRSIFDAFCASLDRPTEAVIGSSAAKFTHLLQESVHVYPRFTPVCEWDLAAGHALLQGVGGQVYDVTGQVWRYNQRPILDQVVFLALVRSQSVDSYFTDWTQHVAV